MPPMTPHGLRLVAPFSDCDEEERLEPFEFWRHKGAPMSLAEAARDNRFFTESVPHKLST